MKVRVHGKSKRRTWRKLHLGVGEATGEIVAAVLSSNNMSDGEVLPQLLEQVEEPITQLSGGRPLGRAAMIKGGVIRLCRNDKKRRGSP